MPTPPAAPSDGPVTPAGPGDPGEPAGRADATAPLELTGERTLPGIADERYWFARHVVAYRLVADRLRAGHAEVVLDAGCGEGYGPAMLADAGAARVVGVDLDPVVVAHADRTYGGGGHPGPARDGTGAVEFHAAELLALPLADDAVDLTVSFQVIEHLHDIPAYLRALAGVTRPGGEVWIATPNRLTFTPGSDVPVNPFHTREFTAVELVAELSAAGLVVTEVLGVHHGPALRAVERMTGRSIPDLVTATAPELWSWWLRRLVHATSDTSFTVRPARVSRWTGRDDIDRSLDLLVRCRVPRPS